MLARERSRKQPGRFDKTKHNRRTGTEKKNGTAVQIKVHLKLFSPSKADRWDPRRHASTRSSPNYTLTMATAMDIDEDLREEILADQRSDTDCESLTSDLEIQIPDWEDYVDPYPNFSWLEMIHGEVRFQRDRRSQETRIADCKAYLIRRDRIADTFWDDMEEPEQELADLAFELFDRFGCLQPKFKEHPIKRGSGIWKDELNDGDILLIEDIRVRRCNRRKEICSKLAHAILELTVKKSRGFFAVTSPEMTVSEVDHEEKSHNDSDDGKSEKLLLNNALQFWRRLGFRRIGSSRWLGYTPDRNHPSHQIDPEQDFDLPSFKPSSFTLEMNSLAMALPTIDDTECLRRLKDIFVDIHLDDITWEARNDNGDTLLHLVSCSSKIECTRWLMFSNPKLCHALNADGSTPLDAMEESMNKNRRIDQYMAKRTDISDRFSGYDQATIFCFALLKGLTPERLSEAEISRLKFGCTCGSCLGGFLSPRLHDRLIFTAEITFDSIYTDGVSLDGPAWCEENKDVFRYLPEHIIQSFAVNKDMIIGFSMIWKHIVSCLRKNMLPTEANILLLVRNANVWPNHSRNFLQNGGTVSSVATMLFRKTMELEEFYDITYEDVDHGVPHNLPSCENDRELGLVSGMCGYERVSRIQLVTMMGKRIRY